MSEAPAPRTPGQRLAHGAIRAYQLSLSALIGRQCRHMPSCSEYTDEAIRRHGVWPGGWMGLSRICRCQPWGTAGYDPVPEALDYLARYPLTEELLAKVTSLETDGGSEIYRYIEYFWDGETDDYTISSLDGIEALVNLKRVRFISMVHDDIDRTPLKRLGIEVK